MKTQALIALIVFPIVVQAQQLSLNQALSKARESRRAVLAAQLDVDRAKLSARALGAYPAVTVGLGQSSREGLGATDQDLFASLPIDLFGRTAASANFGRANVQIAEAEQRRMLLAVQSDVMTAYFEASAATRLSKVAEDLLQVAEDLHKATVRRFEEGEISEVQLTRATIEFDRAKQTFALRGAQLRAALKKLSAATGSDELIASVEVGATIVNPEVNLAQHPEIMVLSAQAGAAQAEKVVAARSHLPELELVGLRTPWRESSPAYGLRLQLTWRVIDFGRSRFEREAASKQAESFQALLEDAVKKAEARIASIDIEIEASRKRLASYEAIREAAKELVAKSQRGFAEGFGTLLDVLEATRSLREIEQDLAEAQLAVNLALAAKYEASGNLIEVQK
ncbi:MAG: TolC family protein [Fimbriimonadales bacterium]|nr:TolC family protein [Fimbriimonadales bacterium]